MEYLEVVKKRVKYINPANRLLLLVCIVFAGALLYFSDEYVDKLGIFATASIAAAVGLVQYFSYQDSKMNKRELEIMKCCEAIVHIIHHSKAHTPKGNISQTMIELQHDNGDTFYMEWEYFVAESIASSLLIVTPKPFKDSSEFEDNKKFQSIEYYTVADIKYLRHYELYKHNCGDVNTDDKRKSIKISDYSDYEWGMMMKAVGHIMDNLVSDQKV